MFFSRFEAAQRGSGPILSQHLLLGCLRDPGTVAQLAIERCGATAEQVGQVVARALPAVQTEVKPGDVPLSSEARQVLDRAAQFSKAVHYLGLEHLLMALAESHGEAGDLLRAADLTSARLSEAFAALATERGNA